MPHCRLFGRRIVCGLPKRDSVRLRLQLHCTAAVSDQLNARLLRIVSHLVLTWWQIVASCSQVVAVAAAECKRRLIILVEILHGHRVVKVFICHRAALVHGAFFATSSHILLLLVPEDLLKPLALNASIRAESLRLAPSRVHGQARGRMLSL